MPCQTVFRNKDPILQFLEHALGVVLCRHGVQPLDIVGAMTPEHLLRARGETWGHKVEQGIFSRALPYTVFTMESTAFCAAASSSGPLFGHSQVNTHPVLLAKPSPWRN